MLIKDRIKGIISEEIVGAMENYGFDYDDLEEFGKLGDTLERLIDIEVPPYIVKWRINEWEFFSNVIFRGMEAIGYELIGNDDMNSGYYTLPKGVDEHHDFFFRFKDINCDYSRTLEIVGTKEVEI